MTYIKKILAALLLSVGLAVAGTEPTTGIQLGDTAIPIGNFPSHIANKGFGGWHTTTNIPDNMLTKGTAGWTNDALYIYDGSVWIPVLTNTFSGSLTWISNNLVSATNWITVLSNDVVQSTNNLQNQITSSTNWITVLSNDVVQSTNNLQSQLNNLPVVNTETLTNMVNSVSNTSWAVSNFVAGLSNNIPDMSTNAVKTAFPYLYAGGVSNLWMYGNGLGVTNLPLYSGFFSKDDNIITFSNATRTLYFWALSGCRYNLGSERQIVATNWTATITDTEGQWFIYRDKNDALQVTQTPWTIIGGEAQVAFLYWNKDAQTNIYLIDERHTPYISDYDHWKEHEVESTEWLRGGDIIWNSTAGVPSTSGSNTVFSISPVKCVDEDLTNWTTAVDQIIGNQNFVAYTNDGIICPILCVTGAVASPLLRSYTNSYFAFAQSGGRPVYNLNTGTIFTTNAVPEDHYFIQLICKIPSVTGLSGIVSLPYTNTFTTLTGAQNVAVSTYLADRTSNFSPETKPLYKCYYQFNAQNPLPYSPLVQNTKLVAVDDLRYGNQNITRTTGSTPTPIYPLTDTQELTNLVNVASNIATFASNTVVAVSNSFTTLTNSGIKAINMDSSNSWAGSTLFWGSDDGVRFGWRAGGTGGATDTSELTNLVNTASNIATFASNTVMVVSNIAVSASNTAWAVSNQVGNLPTSTWDTVIVASNVAATASNTAFAVSNFVAGFSNNVYALPTNAWNQGSNTALWASQTVAAVSNSFTTLTNSGIKVINMDSSNSWASGSRIWGSDDGVRFGWRPNPPASITTTNSWGAGVPFLGSDNGTDYGWRAGGGGSTDTTQLTNLVNTASNIATWASNKVDKLQTTSLDITASMSVQDIYDRVEELSKTAASGTVYLTWSEHCDYGTNSISVDRIVNYFNANTTGKGNYWFTNGPCVVLRGSYSGGAGACTLTFADNPANPSAEGMLNVFNANAAVMIDNLTLVYTNGTRPGTGVRSQEGSSVIVRNVTVTNASTGFMANFGAVMQIYTNCNAVNCDNGFGIFSPASIQFQQHGSLATNCSNGFIAYRGSTMIGDSRNLRAHCCDVGFYSLYKATLFAGASSAISNRYCYYAQDGGWINAASATYASYSYVSRPYFDTIYEDGSTVYNAGAGQSYTMYAGTATTSAQLQSMIDSIGKDLNRCTIAISLASNVYSITQPTGIAIQYFRNGTLYMYGTNANAYNLATNNATIFDSSTAGHVRCINLAYNTARIYIRGIKFLVPNSVGATCIYNIHSPTTLQLQQNCYYGTNSSEASSQRGISSLNGCIAYDTGSTVLNVAYGWDGSYGNIYLDACRSTGGTIPTYAATAYNSMILAGGTNYQGSTAKFSAANGGLVVTNTGKILP